MNNNLKRAVISFGIAVLPLLAFAQSSDNVYLASLMEQVRMLQAQASLLQAQVAAILGGVATEEIAVSVSPGSLAPPVLPPTVPSPPCPSLTANLSGGSRDSLTAGQVSQLQRFLSALPGIYPSGEITGFFGVQTSQAVRRFQAKHGIVSSGETLTTGYGVVGAMTRKKIQEICVPPNPPANSVMVVSPNGGEVWQKNTLQNITWTDNSPPFPPCITAPCPASASLASTLTYDIYLYANPSPCSIDKPCPAAPFLAYTIARNVRGNSYLWKVGFVEHRLNIKDGGYTIRVQKSKTGEFDESDTPFSIVVSKPVPSDTLRIDPASLSLTVGERKQIKAYVQSPMPPCPSGICAQVLPPSLEVDATWSSSNPGIVDFEYATSVCPLPSPYESNSMVVCNPMKTVFVVGKSSGITEVKAVYTRPGSREVLTATAKVSVVGLTNQPPTISGVSGPTALSVGQQGTWTVNASDPEGGTLSYYVLWGDETPEVAASAYQNRVQTATFTHTYTRAGTFTPVFTVTDSGGLSERTSISVTVGPITQLSIITASLPSATVGTAYSASIFASGGSGSYSWDLASGTLPPWLVLVQGVCIAIVGPCQAPVEISGTPTTAGTYTFTVLVSDGASKASKQFTILVVSKPVSSDTLRIVPASLSLTVGERKQIRAYVQSPMPPMPPCSPGIICAQVLPPSLEVDATWFSSNLGIVDFEYATPVCPLPSPYDSASTVICNPTKAVFVIGKSSGITEVKAVYTRPGSREVLTATAKVSVGLINQPITVISPNGGESWAIGSDKTVTWALAPNSQTTKQFAVELLSLDKANKWTIFSFTPANQFLWNVGQVWQGDKLITIQPGSYYVRVWTTATDGRQVFDDSDTPFSIVSQPDLTVADIYDDTGKLSVKISNIGTASVPSNTGHLYIWIGDQLKWTYSLGTLSNQSFLSPRGTSVVQPQMLSGQHKIKASIDPNNAIVESNESNNVLEKTLTFY